MQYFGVIGHPVMHSLSPQVHGAAFKAAGIDAVSEKIEVKPEDLENFMKHFGEKYSGVNVTIPHKETIMKFLDEIDTEATACGAVNLVANRNGKLFGFNVDMYGAMMAIAEKISNGGFSKLGKFLQGKKVIVLGAGGASRAVSFGVLKHGGKLTILNRHKKRADILAEDFSEFFPDKKINTGTLDDFDAATCDILINTTPCGMIPDDKNTPLPRLQEKLQKISKKPLVMDIVYRPLETRFLREAKKAGCETISGERMFLHQAAKGFEIWTEQKAPFEAMEKALYSKISY